MEEYDDTKDADFNPVYCDQTLSDVESEENTQENDQDDSVPEVVELKDNSCMFITSQISKHSLIVGYLTSCGMHIRLRTHMSHSNGHG